MTKTSVLGLRFTAEERAHLQKAAEVAQTGLAAWARIALLDLTGFGVEKRPRVLATTRKTSQAAKIVSTPSPKPLARREVTPQFVKGKGA